MNTNETKAVVLLREIIDGLKSVIEAQDKEIKRLREQVRALEDKYGKEKAIQNQEKQEETTSEHELCRAM